MRKRRLFAAMIFASLVLLAVGYCTGVLIPLPNSYRPAHRKILTPATDRKLEAARSIVSWIVDAKLIPGFDEKYVDDELMKGQKHFIVVCPFVAEDAALSTDSRVYRVDSHHVTRVQRKYGSEFTDYITLSLVEESEQSFRIDLFNHFGSLGGHWYSFHFRETEEGLVAEGRCTGVM